MWLHRSGYHPPNENIATHCRRRYRLTPAKTPNPNIPPCDPSLWIIHYSKASATDHIPANRIPIVPQIQNILSQRRFLQSQGQLPRKEFMLHDRNSWPTINLPSQQGQQGVPPSAAAYQTALHARQQQGAFYPQQGPVVPGSAGPTPSKAPRAPRGSTAAMAGADMSLEDEEVSTGDFLDMLTPREISKMRYKQHHEWMEEVFSSPYTNRQIVPVELGLGRKGELESLTAAYFNAPTGSSLANKEGNERSGAERIAPEKAEEFTDRVTRKVADMNAEIEKMKRRHARRMEKVGRTKLLKDAELKLRDAVTDPSDVGSEVWRLEGRREPEEDGSASPIDQEEQKPKHKIDDVVRDLETAWGAKIIPAPTITCVEKGGFQDRVEVQEPEETLNNEKELSDMDVVMDNADSHVRDQFGSTVNSPFTGGPFNGDENLAVADSSGTFNMDGPDMSEPAKLNVDHNNAPPIQDMDIDVEMSGVLNDSVTASANNEDTGDWVMVNNESEKPSPPKDSNAPSADIQPEAAPVTTATATSVPAPATTAGISPQAPAPESTPAVPAPVENIAASTSAPTTSPAPAPAPTSQPAAVEGSAADAAPQAPQAPVPTSEPQQEPPQQQEQPSAPIPAEPTTSATELPTIDSAGDALAAYSDQQQNNNNSSNEQGEQTNPDTGGSGSGELDLPDMENSAFGDAFHVSDVERTENQTQEQEQEPGEDPGQGQTQVEGGGDGGGDEGGNIS